MPTGGHGHVICMADYGVLEPTAALLSLWGMRPISGSIIIMGITTVSGCVTIMGIRPISDRVTMLSLWVSDPPVTE